MFSRTATLFDTTDIGLADDRFRNGDAEKPQLCASWSKPTFAIVAGLLIGFIALAYAKWQLAGAVVPWDSKNHFYPMYRFLGEALRRGVVPLWNPYHFAGYPAVADPQSLLFTPSLALCALLAPRASMSAFDAMIALHLAAGGIGIVGYCRRLRWHPEAALLAALVFAFGGSAAARLQHTGMIVSYSFFPLAFWALQAAMDRRSIGLAVLAGCLIALMALGRDQVAFLLCLVVAGSVLYQACRAPDLAPYVRHHALVISIAAIVTATLMAVPILLTLQFIRDSNRPGIAYGVALEGSLDPANLLTLLAPNVFGSLDRIYDYWGPGASTIAGNDWTDRSIDYLFVGTLPLVLVVWHGLAGCRLFERHACFFTVILMGTLFYAFGRFTPVFGFAFDWMPGVALYRRPADATFVANIGMALSSGSLLNRFVERGSPKLRLQHGASVLLISATLLGAGVVVGIGLTFAAHAGHLWPSARSLLASVPWVAAMAAGLVVLRTPALRRVGALVLVLVTAGQLVWRNAASSLNAEPASTYSAYVGLSADQARGLAVLKAELATRHDQPRVELLGLDGSWQNASMVLKLQNTAGYNPLRIADYEHAVGVAESATDLDLRDFPGTFRGYNSRLAALLDLDYLILDRPLGALPRSFPRPRGTLVFAGSRFYIYRLEHAAIARAYLVTRLKSVESRRAIEGGIMPAFDPPRDALLDSNDVAAIRNKNLLDGAAPDPAGATVVIDSYDDDRLVLDVQSPAGGVVVLHDIAYPGWQGRVDGEPRPMLRTDLLFRGIEVSAGHHRVEFSFHPLSLSNLSLAAGELMRKGTR